MKQNKHEEVIGGSGRGWIYRKRS